MEDNPRHYDIPIWFNGTQNWMTGLTRRTTCDDIVYALLYSSALHETESTDNYAIFEKWREVERPLSSRTKILKVWSSWGEEQPNVQLTMRSLDDYFLPGESSLYLRSRRRIKKSGRHKSKHTAHCRCHNRRGCVDCSRLRSLEQLVKLMVSQERKIQEINDRIYDSDMLIERHESRIHDHRVQQNGMDYVQDSYLNSHSSESSSSLDRLSFTSLDLKDVGDVFPESTYHELEEISQLCNDLAHVDRRLEEEKAKIQKLTPEVEDLARKMGVVADIEGETNSELEDTRTEMIRAVTVHVTNEYNEREVDRKMDMCLHQLDRQMDLFRQLNEEIGTKGYNVENGHVESDDIFLPRVQGYSATPSTKLTAPAYSYSDGSKSGHSMQPTHYVSDKDTPMHIETDSKSLDTNRQFAGHNTDNLPEYPLVRYQQSTHQGVIASTADPRTPGQKKTVTFASDNPVVHALSDNAYISSSKQNSSVYINDFSLSVANGSEIGNNSATVTSNFVKNVLHTATGRDSLGSPSSTLSRQSRSSLQIKDGLKVRSRSADRSTGHHRDRSRGLRQEHASSSSQDRLTASRDYDMHLVNQYGLEITSLPSQHSNTAKYDTRFENSRYTKDELLDKVFPKDNTRRSELALMTSSHDILVNKGDKSPADAKIAPNLPQRQQRYDSLQLRDICEQIERPSTGVTHSLDHLRKQQGEQLVQANNVNNRILTVREAGPGGDNIPYNLLREIKDSSVPVHNKGHLFDHGISEPQKPSQNNDKRALQSSVVNRDAGPGPVLSARVGESKVSRDHALRSSLLHHRQVSEPVGGSPSNARDVDNSPINQKLNGPWRGWGLHVNQPGDPPNPSDTREVFPYRNSSVKQNSLPSNEQHLNIATVSSLSSCSSSNTFTDRSVAFNSDHGFRHNKSSHRHAHDNELNNTSYPGQKKFYPNVIGIAPDSHLWSDDGSPSHIAAASDDESVTRYQLAGLSPDSRRPELRRGSAETPRDRSTHISGGSNQCRSQPSFKNSSVSFDKSSRGALYHIVTSKINKSTENQSQEPAIPKNNLSNLNYQPHDITNGKNSFKISIGDIQYNTEYSSRPHEGKSVHFTLNESQFHETHDRKAQQGKGNHRSFHDVSNVEASYPQYGLNGMTLKQLVVSNGIDQRAALYPTNGISPSGDMLKQNMHKVSTHAPQNNNNSSGHVTGVNTVNLKDIPGDSNHRNSGDKLIRSVDYRSYGNRRHMVGVPDGTLGRTKIEDNNDSNSSDTGLSSMHSDETTNMETLV
ncbi:hypothetical protein Btru_045061 [Bulinus truncatus]|nr:hypothetical protein Btru_045061 [Bulinus truncatus]